MAQKPRNIFEDVGDAPRATAAATGGIDKGRGGARRGMRIWLMVLFVMVMGIIAVGGMTRLTDSGLSITEWNPVTGAIPPLNDADWQTEFAAYQLSPEYMLQNSGMTLDQFKAIFWWEWGHRQIARAIGLVWFVGFVGLWASRRIPQGWWARLFAVGVLIGVQGAVGWWMVYSGLQGERVDVASYRLATHLGLAFAILGYLAWLTFRLGRREADLLQARRLGDAGLARAGSWLAGLAFVQVLLGALVAGIDAGRAFPTWPRMGDGWLPPDPFALSPLWRNFFEDAGLVQFIHRMTAYVLFALGIWVWTRARKSAQGSIRFAFAAVMAMMLVQVVLGIFTALYSAPVSLSIVHQVGAVALWVLVLRARFIAGHPLPQSVRGA